MCNTGTKKQVKMKVISTKRTTVKMDLLHLNTPVVWLPFLGSWIINDFENSGKRGSAPGKKNLRVPCPMGKEEFKYFSSPGYTCKSYLQLWLVVQSKGTLKIAKKIWIRKCLCFPTQVFQNMRHTMLAEGMTFNYHF